MYCYLLFILPLFCHLLLFLYRSLWFVFQGHCKKCSKSKLGVEWLTPVLPRYLPVTFEYNKAGGLYRDTTHYKGKDRVSFFHLKHSLYTVWSWWRADDRGREKGSSAAGDESVAGTDPGEQDPLGLHISPLQPQAQPQGPRGPLIVPKGHCLMHCNEPHNMPWWHGGDSGTSSYVPSPTLCCQCYSYMEIQLRSRGTCSVLIMYQSPTQRCSCHCHHGFSVPIHSVWVRCSLVILC